MIIALQRLQSCDGHSQRRLVLLPGNLQKSLVSPAPTCFGIEPVKAADGSPSDDRGYLRHLSGKENGVAASSAVTDRSYGIQTHSVRQRHPSQQQRIHHQVPIP